MTYICSAIFGVLSLGWVHLAYLYFFNVLYFSFEVSPKVQYCREFIHGEFCNSLVYLSLWLMELPLAIFSFVTFSLFLVLVRKYLPKLKVNFLIVVSIYVITYFAYLFLGPYREGTTWFSCFTALFHGVVFFISGLVVHHLTRRSSTVSASPPLDSI